jgi:hypothetical protein
LNLSDLKSAFIRFGVKKAYIKILARNDNSKNQVYFGPGFQSLNLFPIGSIVPDKKNSNPIFKAKLSFSWMTESGGLAEAPNAQLILYPQYPEIRFSGFLRLCSGAPSSLMSSRRINRVLFLGITENQKIIGHVADANSPISNEIFSLGELPKIGVFNELTISPTGVGNSREVLLGELRRICNLGWIDSKQLDNHGLIEPCNAPQCGGFTLEAELRIPKNSKSGPDFLGWEIKQYSVGNRLNPDSGSAITLMTPEPTGGFYKDRGVEEFVRKFGYFDRRGRPDRMNFGGIHRNGEKQRNTGLTMQLHGYDFGKQKIIDPGGALRLVTDRDEVAAEWGFVSLLSHWSRKHMHTAYIPSIKRNAPSRQYRYGPFIRLAEGTDSLHLLKAIACGEVYYDPGIKLEKVSSAKPFSKKRSQFRMAFKNIATLYEKVELLNFNP